jgi:methylthioribulose-1-phosphate dehydratase
MSFKNHGVRDTKRPHNIGAFFMLTNQDLKLAELLTQTIRFFNQKGWSPATSTNYSARSSNPQKYIISRSGVDKSLFEIEDLILIDTSGSVLPPFERPGVKSSAETEIHTAIYSLFPEVNCVLHTHSVLGTVLSQTMKDAIVFEGLEIIKGLEGNVTHEMSELLPIVPNSQAMPEVLADMSEHFKRPGLHGFLIAGHGLYTWGKDIPTAKRHVETFEFLFECHHIMRRN